MVYDVAILGGGASGMAAAVSLAKKGFTVAIMEAKPRIGQKILVTGNGRCNLTNLAISRANYHSENLDGVDKIITKYGCKEVMEFFASIGLLTRSKNGLVYPLSNKASSVLDVLRNALAKYKVNIITNFDISSVDKQGGKYGEQFFIKGMQSAAVQAKKLIIATGLKAHEGSDIGLVILEKLGHRVKKPYPALVQRKSDDSFINGLKGIKFMGEIRIFRGQELLRAEQGEILFTDYGISGIAVMQVSYLFSLYDDLRAELDFLPHMSYNEAKERLEYIEGFYKDSSVAAEEYLTGLVDKKLGMRILKYSGAGNSDLLNNLKARPIKITGHNGFKNAQVCGGGAFLDDFDSETLESKHLKGLYAIGEILDAVGDCGGYNLHWAWATALYAADVLEEVL